MGKIIGALVLAILTCSYANIGMAQVAETATPYPDPQCPKPDLKMIKPPQFRHVGDMYDSGPVGSYNSKVKAYNEAAKAYSSCVHAYIDSANREVQRIQDQANANLRRITDAANASMQAIHYKILHAIADANDVETAQQNSTAALQTGQ